MPKLSVPSHLGARALQTSPSCCCFPPLGTCEVQGEGWMEQGTPGDGAGHPRGHLQPKAGCAGRRPHGNKGPVLPKRQASCTQQGRTQHQQPRTHPAPRPRPQQPWGCPWRPPLHPAIEPADGPPSPRHRARLNWLILFPSWQGNWGSVVSPAGSGQGLSLLQKPPGAGFSPCCCRAPPCPLLFAPAGPFVKDAGEGGKPIIYSSGFSSTSIPAKCFAGKSTAKPQPPLGLASGI